jgi:hypothetical protein
MTGAGRELCSLNKDTKLGAACGSVRLACRSSALSRLAVATRALSSQESFSLSDSDQFQTCSAADGAQNAGRRSTYHNRSTILGA